MPIDSKNNLIAPDIHGTLFDYVRKGACSRFGWANPYAPPTLERAKDIIRSQREMKKDLETGLWYHIRAKNSVSQHEQQHTRHYFQVFWPSGRLLARKMAATAHAHLIDDKCVVSIGSGSGLAEIYILKKRKPRLMACIDNDVFARAAIELNAAANEVHIGESFVVLDHAKALQPVADGQKYYRLYDTILTADCLYGEPGVREREIRELVCLLHSLNRQGADVIIAERDNAEIYRRQGREASAISYECYQKQTKGLIEDGLIFEESLAHDRDAMSRIGFRVYDETEPVKMFHWAASHTSSLLPRVDIKWWQPPALEAARL